MKKCRVSSKLRIARIYSNDINKLETMVGLRGLLIKFLDVANKKTPIELNTAVVRYRVQSNLLEVDGSVLVWNYINEYLRRALIEIKTA